LFYEPKDFEHWDGSGVQEFPFRRDTFITTPNKAITSLGWKPTKSITKDIEAEVALYEKLGGKAEEWSIKELKYDFEVIASKDSSFTFTYPFFDGPDVNTESRPYPFESTSQTGKGV